MEEQGSRPPLDHPRRLRGSSRSRVVAAILICAASGGDDDDCDLDDLDEQAPSGCEEVEAPKPKQVSFKAPKQTLKKGEKLTAVVQTSCGTFEIALDTSGRRRRPTRSPSSPKKASTTTSPSTGSPPAS